MRRFHRKPGADRPRTYPLPCFTPHYPPPSVSSTPVLLYDRSSDRITKGLALVDKLLTKDVSKGRIQPGDTQDTQGRIQVVSPEGPVAYGVLAAPQQHRWDLFDCEACTGSPDALGRVCVSGLMPTHPTRVFSFLSFFLWVGLMGGFVLLDLLWGISWRSECCVFIWVFS